MSEPPDAAVQEKPRTVTETGLPSPLDRSPRGPLDSLIVVAAPLAAIRGVDAQRNSVERVAAPLSAVWED